jgi:5-methylcytosine-specific restriction endonuclease McrA
MSLPFKFRQKKVGAKTDRQKLINKLDTSFSEFVRLRDSDHQGVCKCITCGDFKHWQSIDCGHFITRDNMSTRWDEQNCNAQCQHCNRFKSGKQFEHGLAIDKKYKEPGLAAKLHIKSKSPCNWTDQELETMHKYYKAEAKALRESKGMI